ncbi:helix-turn-helix domain-containing protein [Parasporobacterium paucivorans]|nr:hypothetical protein [Parasporobacterium paucivorans]
MKQTRNIYVVEAIYILSLVRDYVNVSDISGELKVTRPSITKLINESKMMGVASLITAITGNNIFADGVAHAPLLGT